MKIIYLGRNTDYWFARARDVFAGIGILATIIAMGFAWERFT